MCAGAMLQSRIGTLVYGARNTLSGGQALAHRMPAVYTGGSPASIGHSFTDVQLTGRVDSLPGRVFDGLNLQ